MAHILSRPVKSLSYSLSEAAASPPSVGKRSVRSEGHGITHGRRNNLAAMDCS
jgi:hypothetical protein